MTIRWPGALAIMAIAALCLAPLAQTGPPASIREPVNPGWLKLDMAIAAKLKKHLPPSAGDAMSFLKAVGAVDIRTIELGFGNLRHEGTIAGGYVPFIIKVLARGKGIASLRIEMPIFNEPSQVKGEIKRAWAGMAVPYEHGIRYEYNNPSLYKEMLLAVENALGKQEHADPAAQAGAYRTLTDPFAKNDVGHKCYYAGVAPEGRKAIEILKAAARYDLVRGALRSMSPEGRVYAALALLDLRGVMDIPKADYDAIDVIRDLDIDISVCDGCLVHNEKARDVLP